MYERWENFDKTIGRAMESCGTSNIPVTDHFREITKMVLLGSGAKRKIKDCAKINLANHYTNCAEPACLIKSIMLN